MFTEYSKCLTTHPIMPLMKNGKSEKYSLCDSICR